MKENRCYGLISYATVCHFQRQADNLIVESAWDVENLEVICCYPFICISRKNLYIRITASDSSKIYTIIYKEKMKLFSGKKRIYKWEGGRRVNTAQETKWIHRIKLFGSSKDADSLVRAYYDEIYIFVARQISDKELARDLTQEIFISMLRSIASYQKKRSSFRTWLYRIATNKIIDFRRKALPDTIPLDELDETETVDYVGRIDYENNIVQAEFLEKIEKYVSSFQLDIQQIFRLHIYGGQTFQEIAVLTGMPEASVKSKYYRLIRQVRREFYDEYTEIVRS